MPSIMELPVEILSAIAQYLDETDRSAMALTSRQWRDGAWLAGRNLSWRAVQRASLAMTQWAMARGLPVRMEGLEYAAEGGNREIVQWMLRRHWPQAPRLLYSMLRGELARESLQLRHLSDEERRLQRAGLAEIGDLSAMSDLYSAIYAEDFWIGAACGAQEKVLDWLQQHGAGLSLWASTEAIARGHLAIAQKLIRLGHSSPPSLEELLARDAPAWAVKWARDEFCLPLTPNCLAMAAQIGDDKAVEWLLASGCPVTDVSLCSAVAGGSIAAFELLQMHKCAIDTATINEAMGYCRNIALLERVAAWHSHANEDACQFAASSGNFASLRWLVDHQWPLTAHVAEIAAAHGYLTMVQFLHTRGCPWSDRVRTAAVDHFEWDVIEWLDNSI